MVIFNGNDDDGMMGGPMRMDFGSIWFIIILAIIIYVITSLIFAIIVYSDVKKRKYSFAGFWFLFVFLFNIVALFFYAIFRILKGAPKSPVKSVTPAPQSTQISPPVAAQPVLEEIQEFCPNCGSKNESESAEFCMFCGASLKR